MDIIDNFSAAVQQFLKHRIDSLLFEIDSTNKQLIYRRLSIIC